MATVIALHDMDHVFLGLFWLVQAYCFQQLSDSRRPVLQRSVGFLCS